jgi:uncharacterized protein YlzI (FlbEa/FlbD family)
MAKRGNGEGSVSPRPRADGLWVARYTVVEDGVTRRPALYGRTRQEASRKLRAALVARDDSLEREIKPVQADRPVQHGNPQAVSSTTFYRIAAKTPDGISDVWVNPESIESIEAATGGHTTIRLRSGRPLLLDQPLDSVLRDLS